MWLEYRATIYKTGATDMPGKLFLMFLPHMNQNTDFKSVLVATEMQIKGVKYDNYTTLLAQ